MPNLVETLHAAVVAHPDRIAIRMGPAAIGYADLLSAAARFGHRLRIRGIDPGDRVAIATATVPAYAVAYYGALLAGGVVVPLNPLQPEPVLAARLLDSGASTLVVTPRPPHALQRAASIAAVPLIEIADLSDGTGEIESSPAADGDPAAIVYKSSDGDQPAGVVLSHGNLGWSAAAAASVLRLTTDDTLTCGFPLFHPLGQTYGLGAAIAAGSCLALPAGGAASLALSTVEADGATVLGTFSALVGTILADSTLRRRDVSTLRTVFCAGGPVLEPRVRKRLEAGLSCDVVEGYGTFESSALSCATRSGSPRRPGSVGAAIPGVEVAVVDGRGREAPSGKAGQLLLRGPNVTSGYWERPSDTARAFSNGWLLTGDKARRDSAGNVYLLDGVLWADPVRGRHSGRTSLLRRGLSRLRS